MENKTNTQNNLALDENMTVMKVANRRLAMKDPLFMEQLNKSDVKQYKFIYYADKTDANKAARKVFDDYVASKTK
jgi:hypothetical protein